MQANSDSARRPILRDRQIEMGAQFGVVAEREVVLSYGAPLDEYDRVRDSAGLIEFPHTGFVRITGSEGERFLNGLVTNDVRALTQGRGMRAAFLTGHGKVKALCRIIGEGDSYLIINDPQTQEKVYQYVFPFSYAGDFIVQDLTPEYGLLSVQGPMSILVMKEICFEPLPDLNEHDWTETVIAGHAVRVIKESRVGDQGFDLMVRMEGLPDVWDFILLKGQFHGLAAFGLEALEILRLEAGMPIYGIDIDETNMMLETGLDDAVSFTKGCYTGQEAVAMATYRGHVSKRLSGLIIEGETVPNRGEKIRSGDRDVGVISSAGWSPRLGKPIALGYIKYGSFDPGLSVEIQSRTGALLASTVKTPFYRKPQGDPQETSGNR